MICRECKRELDIKDFHPKRRVCRKCVYQKHKLWKKNNPNKIREQKSRHREKYKDRPRPSSKYHRTNTEYNRKYYLAHPERWRKYRPLIDEWRKNNPEKVNAHNKLRFAIEAGTITRPKNCSRCNRETKVVGHHTDYTKPLDVIWFCTSCHRKEHSSLKRAS